ncbi:hypothetical protein HW132_02765 [Brasilonema sp. CT11]|nr:hypothetical protein [Brasilonema sp. CT11]
MHTQGYSLPEPINLQNQDDDIYFVASQDQMSDEVNKKTEKHGDAEDLQDNTREGEKEGEKEGRREGGKEGYLFSPTPPLSYAPDGRVLSARLVHEIVVEDIFDETEPQTFKNQPSKQKEESVSDVSVGLPVLAEITEPLPVPQLHLSSGELISGKFVRIRIQLAPVADEVAVKLWILDCQTRGLIGEPRWLTNLRLNPAGVLEEITNLRVPFGCLEIRLEAIAVNKATQQESHKVSILLSVMPPDLARLQLNEVFGV